MNLIIVALASIDEWAICCAKPRIASNLKFVGWVQTVLRGLQLLVIAKPIVGRLTIMLPIQRHTTYCIATQHPLNVWAVIVITYLPNQPVMQQESGA